MADHIMDNPGPVVRWMAAAVMVIAVSVAWATVEESKYKAEAMSSAAESFSKVMIVCIESGQADCNEKYRMVIK